MTDRSVLMFLLPFTAILTLVVVVLAVATFAMTPSKPYYSMINGLEHPVLVK